MRCDGPEPVRTLSLLHCRIVCRAQRSVRSEITVKCPKTAILAIGCWLVASGCLGGTLEVDDGTDNGHQEQDTNVSSEDTGPEDADPECCTPNVVECTDSAEYRECDPIGEFCGHWTEPMDCPLNHVCDATVEEGDPCDPLCTENHPDWGEPCTSGQGVCEREGTLTECDGDELVCDAAPGEPEPKECNGRDSNCDGEIDSEDICSTCVDDEHAPTNYDYQGDIPYLGVGDTFDDLVLCDNEISLDSENWFYLGTTTELHVHLEWKPEDVSLGLRIAVEPEFGTPATHGDAGPPSGSELTYQQSLSESGEFYAVVYYRDEEKPDTGAHYTISRPN